ncbi:ABC transporter permease [Rhodococcus hoagii]|jgi:ABC-2 type transport system permease protein|uniref:Transport permease protein n=1 Tax=Rhodococcus hoagii (strain 103S) TaxID=685727 RepID=A0A3S5YAW6_RHOH1|nr:ABC transporter permease [Prescottella equi]GBF16062.1 daunorubicin/doxorubicin resistance ABC transporter permease protein DrrB [Rhodococcus sp. Br-6]MDP8013332.1 ABC transporter permease [Prescottella equi]NKR87878.1 ABC transporter permease [Prescottella equi]NKR97981.1 ABC transporter permease [Prescottella equi]NKS08246.1 ABC transporter permease [Prescottella equi]
MTTTLTSPARQANTRTIEATDRIGLREAIAHSLTLAHRGLLKVKHNPEQLFDVVIQPIIFTFMFTYIFGGAISGDVESYLPIIIPGILVQTVITASIVTGTQLREDMDKGVFDRFKSLPIARIAPLSGALIADVVRYLIATTITVVVGIAMGYRPGGGFVGVVYAAMLVMVCAFAISWIFALMGVLMSKAASVQGTSMMILFPLTFMSNAFVPADTMPGWMQAFVNVNPVSHLVTAVRELANSGHFGIHAVYALLGAAVIVAIMAPLTVRIYMRKA